MKTLNLIILLMLFLTGCKPKQVEPIVERIAKSWIAESVQEGSSMVYSKNGTNNSKPGYAGFKLALSSTGSVVYTEFDGNSFTGQWELIGENKLILKNLNPQPTGTNGTIEFNITSFSDNQLTLTRTSSSAKTGGTINVYILTIS